MVIEIIEEEKLALVTDYLCDCLYKVNMCKLEYEQASNKYNELLNKTVDEVYMML